MDLYFKQLKKNAKADISRLPQYKLAILGNCATQHVATAIRGYGYHVGLGMDIFDSDYNQIDAQTMDPASELYTFAPNGVLIYMCSEKLYEKYCETPMEVRATFAEDTYGYIRNCWNQINANIQTTILQFNFAMLNDGAFGNYANKAECSFVFQLRKLNYLLMEGCQQVKNVYLVDLDMIQSEYGRNQFADPKLYYIAKMPISLELLPEAAKRVVDTIQTLRGSVKKCVICDLDNTLWGGVIGDDGLNGIQIGELGTGHAFSELQMWLKDLKNRGILLAVCSKNNEENARLPFEQHPEMVLKLEDFSMFVANWEDKAGNIRNIQRTLNIGMDSMVFLDDNPFERNLVRGLIPEICVPELPEDPALYLRYLRSLNLFETASYSADDAKRTQQYREESVRRSFETSFTSYDDYLQGLEMKAVAAPFDSFYYPRIAQLTQRSNQFNLRTVRYTEAQIEAVAKDDDHLTIYFMLKDKFGDHGLISVVILDKQENATLFVSEWLMSCLVLKRGMEEFIVNKMVQTAKEHGFKKIIGEYLPTPKNAMVKNLYETMGFTRVDENRFELNTESFTFHKTYIEEE